MEAKKILKNCQRIYFIGIGGISMSGLAKRLLSLGYNVSGSDKTKSKATKQLTELGAQVFYGHTENNLTDAELVVYSSAINKDNPEYKKAEKLGLPLIKRSELLGEILKEFKYSVAISGCHGKTTTTAMLGQILVENKADPTIFLGGNYGEYGNYRQGNGDYVIAEACEYKKSFLDIQSKIAVVLNIDNDHLDSYSGEKDLVQTFKSFVSDKLAVINADEPKADQISNCTTVTFGINNIATYYAKDIKPNELGYSFTACAYAKTYGKINLKVSGQYNVYNALAAFATADLLGVPFYKIKRGLESFKGVQRRCERLGDAQGLEWFADYAHHPTEIKAVLSAFKENGDNFITIFQPHTYSRTRLLFKDFLDTFKGVNNLILYNTYPAREKFDRRGSAKTLANALTGENLCECAYAHSRKELENKIAYFKGENKKILFLGAGDIYETANALLKKSGKYKK